MTSWMKRRVERARSRCHKAVAARAETPRREQQTEPAAASPHTPATPDEPSPRADAE